MNTLKFKVISLSLLSFLTLFMDPISAFAQSTNKEQKIVTLMENQTINHDYFAAGDQVTINGTINGDAYIAGGKIDINGTINGDLLVAGGQIIIRGRIAQNIGGGGGNITVQGTVGRNLTLVGGNLTVEPSARIAGNAVVAGGNIDILSQVKNLSVAGGNVQISSGVLGDVMAGVGSLAIGSGANIQGDLNYWSEHKATIENGASISGKTTLHITKDHERAKEASKKATRTLTGIAIFFTTVSFFASLFLGLLITAIFPIYSQKATSLIVNKMGTAILVGLAAFILVPVLAISLLITVVGFPAGLILGFFYFTTLYISKIFASMAIGTYLTNVAKFKTSPFWTFVLGLLLYYAVGFIPVIGFLAQAVATLAGMGAIILQKKYYFDTLSTKKLI
jgi:hypothetical protein